jgi:small-conductance mechanosensitive channel
MRAFGPSSLDFEVVYYVLDSEYLTFMDRQQTVNFALIRRFAEEGIEFAFPTRTLHVEAGASPVRTELVERGGRSEDVR